MPLYQALNSRRTNGEPALLAGRIRLRSGAVECLALAQRQTAKREDRRLSTALGEEFFSDRNVDRFELLADDVIGELAGWWGLEEYLGVSLYERMRTWSTSR